MDNFIHDALHPKKKGGRTNSVFTQLSTMTNLRTYYRYNMEKKSMHEIAKLSKHKICSSVHDCVQGFQMKFQLLIL